MITRQSIRDYLKNGTISLVLITLGFFLCLFVSYYHPFFSEPFPRALRLTQSAYPLVNPLLLCNVNQSSTQEDNDLEKKVNQYVTNIISQGKANKVSVYVFEYKKDRYVGLNENDQYDPASLLKVPLMIAYYQLAEKNPQLLRQTTSYTGEDQNGSEFFKSSGNIVPNTTYTIEQLIKSMIIHSDNSAATLLNAYVDNKSFINVYTDLGLTIPPNDPSIQSISAKSYAYFFRVLYNGTYLSHADSEKTLELLTQTDFDRGLQAGVPKGVTVAEKFGERSVFNQKNVLVDRELHDCGIVYKPGSPYLLCIMSQGKDFNELDSMIQNLSTLVYNNE